jgi:hypothetical protein
MSRISQTTSYWQKFLSDGTSEMGTDEEILRGVASWTKGRQDIRAVKLVFKDSYVIVKEEREDDLSLLLTDWVQQDRYVAVVSPGTAQKGQRVSRILSCSVTSFPRVRVTEVAPRRFFVTPTRREDSIEEKYFSVKTYEVLPGETKMTCELRRDGCLIVSFSKEA